MPLPLIPGHEGAGIVERVAPDVTSLKPGDHVVCSWNPYCGHCFYCDEGQPILCEKRTAAEPKGFLLDGSTRLKMNGEDVFHYSFVCSHAQYCVVPESGAVVIPKEMPFAQACILGCGVLTGVGAGEWSDDDGWTHDSVFGRCQERLEEMVRLMRQSAKGKPAENDDENGIDEADNGNLNDEDGGDDGDQAHRS